jgi:hypothetical protein
MRTRLLFSVKKNGELKRGAGVDVNVAVGGRGVSLGGRLVGVGGGGVAVGRGKVAVGLGEDWAVEAGVGLEIS